MRFIKTLEDVNIPLRELLDFKTLWTTKSLDLKKRQIKNVGAGVDPDDVLTVKQLKAGVQNLFQTNNTTFNTTTGSGSSGPVSSAIGYYNLPQVAPVTLDLANGKYQVLNLNQDYAINAVIAMEPSELVFIVYQDNTGGWTLTFDSSFIGAAGGYLNTIANPTPGCYTCFSFVIRKPDLRPVLINAFSSPTIWP